MIQCLFPLLAIDYGDKFCGLAIARSNLAEPLVTLPTHTVVSQVLKLIHKEAVTAIIIGLSENQMAQKTKAFGQMLNKVTGLPVRYVDETLSSYNTRVKAAQGGMSKKKREQKLDHFVAATLLQDYLDSHNQ